MEARARSECGTLKGWGLFEIVADNVQHIIGHSPVYGFDVITPELVSFHYDKSSKSGYAITKTGIEYILEGKPIRLNPNGHPQLREFSTVNQCKIRFIKL